VIVEYDLANSYAATGVVVRSAVTIEQTAVPSSLLIMPAGSHARDDLNSPPGSQITCFTRVQKYIY
jgi:hypothetical protein